MRSQVEIEYAIASAEFTRDAAIKMENVTAELVARTILDTICWIQGGSGTALEEFVETALRTEAIN
jgi:hypothetical protein